MQLSLVTPPVSMPVSVEEAKAHLRVEHTAEDSLIESMIAAVTAELDGRQSYLRRALVTQTWDFTLPWFPRTGRIRLPMPPLQSVTSVKYFDASNEEQTLSSDDYETITSADQGYIALKSGKAWPATYERNEAVAVRFVAGYGAASDLPGNIRAAMLLRIGELYAYRGDAAIEGNMSPTVRRLLSPSRHVVLA